MLFSALSSLRLHLRHHVQRGVLAWAYRLHPLWAAPALLTTLAVVVVGAIALVTATQEGVTQGLSTLPDAAALGCKLLLGVCWLLGAAAVVIKFAIWAGDATEPLDREHHATFFQMLGQHGYRVASPRRVFQWEWNLVNATLSPPALAAYRAACLNRSLPVASTPSPAKERF